MWNNFTLDDVLKIFNKKKKKIYTSQTKFKYYFGLKILFLVKLYSLTLEIYLF